MQELHEPLSESTDRSKIIASSAAMQIVLDEIRRAAEADASVLVSGEPGTGKELVAEEIHQRSRRRKGPFLVVNMASIPEALVESELFGQAEDVYGGSPGHKIGRFELADGGTLFIDEIADLKPTAQARLLRVLETHAITPLGSNDSRKIDVRLIAATCRDLQRLVAEGKFREDLYYQLSVIAIALPPLRRRREDIRLLSEYFVDVLCRENNRSPLTIAPELAQLLESCDWPGNVRQLRNCIEGMVILSRSNTLRVDDLPAMVRHGNQVLEARFELPPGVPLAEIVKAAVLQTLDRLDGNRTQAAQSLGISVRTLQRKLKQWQSAPPAGGVKRGLETISSG